MPGYGNRNPRQFKSNNRLGWYDKTPKWKFAEMLLRLMLKDTGNQNIERAFNNMEKESKNPFYNRTD